MLRSVRLAHVVALLTCVGTVLSASTLRAQDQPIQIEPLFGPSASVESWTLDEAGNLTSGEQSAHWTDFRSIRWDRTLADPALSTFDVRLVGGGKVMAERVVLLDEAIQLEFGGERVELPIEWVVGVINRSVAQSDTLDPATLDEDRIIVRLEEGDQAVDGLLEAMTVDGVEFAFEDNVRELDWSRIVSLALATAGLEEAKQGARVSLLNGWVWFGEPVSYDGTQLQIALGDTTISVPADQLLSIEMVSDRVAQLADREPLEVQSQGLLLPPRSFQRNASVLGSPLRVYVAREGGGGTYQEFSRGLGVPSGASLTFDVEDYDRFASLIGLDETSDGRADCEVVIELDGEEAFRQHLSGRDTAVPVDFELRGARSMTLRVEFGEGLELGDHVDFCDARLVRATR